MGFAMASLQYTFAHCKGQGHAYFDHEYLGNGDRQEKHCFCSEIGSNVLAFDWHIHILP